MTPKVTGLARHVLQRTTVIPTHELETLVDALVVVIAQTVPGVREGVVMTPSSKPYRRLDCDGRALAYIRTRRRNQVIRVDVSGLWLVPRDASIREATSSGSGTVFLREPEDLMRVAEFVRETVRRTRGAHAEERREARAVA